MTTHIYVAHDQPATHFKIDITKPNATRASYILVKFDARRKLFATCCHKRRVAENLIAKAYYDHTDFFCKKGKGCKK